MKQKLLPFAAAALLFAACSDDSSAPAQATGGDSPVATSSAISADSNVSSPEATSSSSSLVSGGVSLGNSSGTAIFKGSSCEFDETLLERAGAGKSLKKTSSEEKFGEKAQNRTFYVEESESSVEVSVTGLVSACNKVIKGVDVRVEGDTLYATVNYMPDAETLCMCTWVDLSFTVDKGLLGDSVKTLVIGEEVFTRQEKTETAEGSSEE